MVESSPRVDPDIEKVRKTTELVLTPVFRTFYRKVSVSSFSLLSVLKSVGTVALVV